MVAHDGWRHLGALGLDTTSELHITRVSPCVARGFKARASFMFAGCCWRRSLAVDGISGALGGTRLQCVGHTSQLPWKLLRDRLKLAGDGPVSCAPIGDGSFEECRGQGLHISTHTVNTHPRQVFAKLGVSNQVALAAVVHHSIE